MSTTAITPHTRIDNTIIDECAPKIGLAGLGVLVLIKRYLNQKTGQCNPSYKTLARKAGVDRSTIIRYVKKLKAFNLLDPELQFKEDGSPTSNQYYFPSSHSPTPLVNLVEQDTLDKGGAVMPPPPPQDCLYPMGSLATSPGAPLPPEQSSSSNKKQRTIAESDLMPTEKQKTCPHPPEFIVILPDNITICNHCYGLLDENFRLIEEEKTRAEIVEAA
jgi:helix-turn-helix protein